ncbi:MAG: S-layer homology domain-containing protein [Chloroflexota bacterium]|nr:S-layer homology domain-containing protein [Chloroflexota bacterium]
MEETTAVKTQRRGRMAFAGALLLVIGLVGSEISTIGPTIPAAHSTGSLASEGGTKSSSAIHMPQQERSTVAGKNILVSAPVAAHVSARLSSLPLAPHTTTRRAEVEKAPLPEGTHKDGTDPVIQTNANPVGGHVGALSPAFVNFEGMDLSVGSGVPPDTNGEVGPNHYVQMVNSAVAVYSKSGTLLAGPVNINQIWSGAGTPCESSNDGDPIVLYDQLADRWLISQFTTTSPYNECIAISTSPDPTGTWYPYSFELSTTDFADYPHFGMWPDGYYMGVNQFNGGQTYAGSRPYVFERNMMLQGQTARWQSIDGPLGVNSSLVQPSDLDGSTPPPAGAPDYFVEAGATLNLYRYHVDWTTPANSSWTAAGAVAGAAPYTGLCNSNCIPQPNTQQKLSGVGSRMMYRLAYRNFGGTEVIVGNHNVNANNFAGVRWYEIRNPATAPAIYQQGTWAPADGIHRWMGSVAQDRDANMLAGYSVSSSTVYPGIRYAGRQANDPPGTFTSGEGTIVNGSGVQVRSDRWGDYSDMTVDPTDDCTFWYTTEYNSSGDVAWHTRIASLKFNTCGQGGATPVPTAPVATRTPTPLPPTSTPFPGQCLTQFTDVPAANTFYPYVRCLACRNIVAGYPCGGQNPVSGDSEPCDPYNNPYFRYNNPISRGQISKLVSNSAGFSEDPGPQLFEDIPTGSPFYAFVNRLVNRGAMGGYACGGTGEPCILPASRPYFRPSSNASRGQLSKIVANAAGFSEAHSDQIFTDVPGTSPFYIFVERLASRNAMGGYVCGGTNPETGLPETCDPQNRSYFRPGNTVTRGQSAKIVGNSFFPGCQTP